MNQHAGEVMSMRIEAVNFAVHLMRKPCEGMPVGLVSRCKGPCDRLCAQPSLHVLVFRHIVAVIVVDEGMSDHRRIDRKGRQAQQETPNVDCVRGLPGGDVRDWSPPGLFPGFPGSNSSFGSRTHSGTTCALRASLTTSFRH